jgi:hypothetical protein
MTNEIIQNWLEAFLEVFPRGCEDLFPRCDQSVTDSAARKT